MVFHYFFMIISSSILVGITTDNIKPCLPSSYHLVQFVCFSVMFDFRHNQCAGGRSFASMMRLLLLLSGTESNPGLTKYPCGECKKLVWRSTECEIVINGTTNVVLKCVLWSCYTENSKLEWECCICAIINSSFHADHLSSSPICSLPPNITIKKAKQLRIMAINFQSIWKKKMN